MSLMRIKLRGRSLPRGTAALTAWTAAAATSWATMTHLWLLPVDVFAVGVAIAATVMYAKRHGDRSTQAAFMAGVIHERATGDSEQLPLAAGQTMGLVMRLPDQRRKPRPHRQS